METVIQADSSRVLAAISIAVNVAVRVCAARGSSAVETPPSRCSKVRCDKNDRGGDVETDGRHRTEAAETISSKSLKILVGALGFEPRTR